MTQPEPPKKISAPPVQGPRRTRRERRAAEQAASSPKQIHLPERARLGYSRVVGVFAVIFTVIGFLILMDGEASFALFSVFFCAMLLWVSAAIVRVVEKIYELLHDQAYGLL